MITMASDTLSASVHMTANPIRYHTNDVRSLMKNTLAGLEGNGVAAPGVGERRDGKFILRGGAYLTPTTRATLSLHMGGDARAVPATLDPRTVQFMNAANAMSPAGFKGLPRGTREAQTSASRRDLSGDIDDETSRTSASNRDGGTRPSNRFWVPRVHEPAQTANTSNRFGPGADDPFDPGANDRGQPSNTSN